MPGPRRVAAALALAGLLVACEYETVQVRPEVATPVVTWEDGRPGRADADDAAIWLHPRQPERSLVIGTLKDAGLLVSTLDGEVVQRIVAGPQSTVDGPSPCPGDHTDDVVSRLNNVDLAYGFPLRGSDRPTVDLAVASDWGCDRLLAYAIDSESADGPLTEITAAEAGRVFPTRLVQPSKLQPALEAGTGANPLKNADGAYGIGLWQDGERLYAFVSQRNRSVVAQLRIEPTEDGGVSHSRVRTFHFATEFDLPPGEDESARQWTPCRVDPGSDPQAEGIVVDPQNRTLFVAFEAIGVYRIPLRDDLPEVVTVREDRLLARVGHFGRAYRAKPAGQGLFDCEYDAHAAPPDALRADVEGLALYRTTGGLGYLIVSSQGDDTFHVFERGGANRPLGAFRIEGVGETDGLDVTGRGLGPRFPLGLLVVQNGKAPLPVIERVQRARASQFVFVRWDEVAAAFMPPLIVDATGLDPRAP